MRAKHPTKDLSSESRRPPGGRAGRWLSRLPRAVAAGGALLAQLWGLGAPGAHAAGAEPLPEPASRTAVGRALTGESVLGDSPPDGTVTGGPSAERTAGQTGEEAAGDAAAPQPPVPQDPPPNRPQEPPRSPARQDGPVVAPGRTTAPGVLDHLAGPTAAIVPVPELDAATTSVSSALQDRIRAGGLPLPGQRAALPDAFAIASGLLGTVPAQSRPAGARASREGAPDGPSAPVGRNGAGPRATRPGGEQRGPAAPPPAPGEPGDRPHHTAADRPGTGAAGSGRSAAEPDRPTIAEGSPAAGPAGSTAGSTTTAAVTVAHGAPGTATAVLAPIAAGLALTGAAMYKHRGLPKGH
ncbi:hypothetical protein [Streptomyces sp. BE303]|uniref:hypothetical protein n=1 Tax=Streptomyces sp. BE303 TaxID=3002528 RepID=UPI002E77A545|nr:hypothetical protein [Streptomyces sp. BE303]MED7952700.1 hypothetical protein [Streptomyces sp. BE303]